MMQFTIRVGKMFYASKKSFKLDYTSRFAHEWVGEITGKNFNYFKTAISKYHRMFRFDKTKGEIVTIVKQIDPVFKNTNLLVTTERGENNVVGYNWIDECTVFDYVEPELFNKINFGKYKGKTIYWLLENAPDYIDWLTDQVWLETEHPRLDAILHNESNGYFASKPISNIDELRNEWDKKHLSNLQYQLNYQQTKYPNDSKTINWYQTKINEMDIGD